MPLLEPEHNKYSKGERWKMEDGREKETMTATTTMQLKCSRSKVKPSCHWFGIRPLIVSVVRLQRSHKWFKESLPYVICESALKRRHGHTERGQLHSLYANKSTANALDQYHQRVTLLYVLFSILPGLFPVCCLLFALDLPVDIDTGDTLPLKLHN